MSQVQLQVQGQKEVSDLFDAVNNLVAAVIAKKPVLEIIAQELSQLIPLVSEVSALPDDIKTDPAGCLNSAFLGSVKIVKTALNK